MFGVEIDHFRALLLRHLQSRRYRIDG